MNSWDFPINPEQVALFYDVSSHLKQQEHVSMIVMLLYFLIRGFFILVETFLDMIYPHLKQNKIYGIALLHGIQTHFMAKVLLLIESKQKPRYCLSRSIPSIKRISCYRKRRNRQGQLIVSVAVPVQRYRAVVGALLLSTTGSDIDNIVKAERLVIFKVFVVVGSVLLVLSLFSPYNCPSIKQIICLC